MYRICILPNVSLIEMKTSFLFETIPVLECKIRSQTRPRRLESQPKITNSSDRPGRTQKRRGDLVERRHENEKKRRGLVAYDGRTVGYEAPRREATHNSTRMGHNTRQTTRLALLE